MWNPLRWYAAAFPVTYVLLSYTSTPTPPGGLWRPLLAAVVIGVLVQLSMTLLLRHHARAALVASAVLCLALATWIPLLVLGAGSLWVLVITARRRSRRAWTADRLSGLAQAFAWLLLLVAAVPAGSAALAALPPERATIGEAAADREDVVILMLDGYPRADVLRREFGIDADGFSATLADRGFRLAERSRSNYSSTWMTLASMVNGRLVHTMPGLSDPDVSQAEQYRRLMRAISGGTVLEEFRAAGYEIVTVPSPFESAALNGADRMLTPPQLTSFELSLIQHSLAGRLLLEVAPEIAFEQHRDRVASSLELAAAEMATERRHPRLLFVHVLAPHAPIAFGAAADEPAPACFPDCSLYHMGPHPDWTNYGSHLAEVNALLVDAVDGIIRGSPDATIVAMSDHGTLGPGRETSDVFASFFAARAGTGDADFPAEIAPVDVMRLVLDPTARPTPYRAWLSREEHPLSVVEVTDETAGE